MGTDSTDTVTGWATTDADRIKTWAIDRGATPVTEDGPDGRVIRFARRGALTDQERELEWRTLVETMDRHDLAFVHADDGASDAQLGYHTLTTIDRLADCCDWAPSELEEALTEGGYHPITLDSEPDELERLRGGEQVPAESRAESPREMADESDSAGSPDGPTEGQPPHRSDRLAPADRGKRAVDATGDRLGTVRGIDSEQVHIEPTAGLADRFKARLGWGTRPIETTTVDRSRVLEVTERHVVLDVNAEPEGELDDEE